MQQAGQGSTTPAGKGSKREAHFLGSSFHTRPDTGRPGISFDTTRLLSDEVAPSAAATELPSSAAALAAAAASAAISKCACGS